METIRLGQFAWNVGIPVQVLDRKQVKFYCLVGNSFCQMGSKINKGNFGCREERAKGPNHTMEEAKSNKLVLANTIRPLDT